MGKHLKYITAGYLEAYNSKCTIDWFSMSYKLRTKASFTPEDFEYYLIASSLYSSKIEGNSLDVNSFFRSRGNKKSPKIKEVQEIDELVNAYKFASENILNRVNLLKAHEILSKSMLPKKVRGKVRKVQIGVRDAKTFRPIYLAVEPEFVSRELNKLFLDISELLKRNLSSKEVFYYASMIHLCIALIHPFEDGNGRTARLAEKWFLVSKLGLSAWSIQSEKYYWDNRPIYYEKIALGFNYYALHWDRCISFLLLLPKALEESI